MRRMLAVSGRIVGVTGLAAVSALHVAWVAGSSWPAKNKKALAEAVVGSKTEMPSAGPTLVVAAGTGAAALLAAGAFGEGKLQRAGVRAMGSVMLARACFGGETALAALGLPKPGKQFIRLDTEYYRPLTAVLGVSLWLGSAKR